MNSNLEWTEQAKCYICLKDYPSETVFCGSVLLPYVPITLGIDFKPRHPLPMT